MSTVIIFGLVMGLIGVLNPPSKAKARAEANFAVKAPYEHLKGKMLSDFYKKPVRMAHVPEEFKTIKELKRFADGRCEGAINLEVNEELDLHFFYTNEDSCDGGNAYGFVVSADQTIAIIKDSDFYEVTNGN